MEQLQTKRTDTGLIYGLIAGAASIVFTLILYLGGVDLFTGPLAYLAFVIPVVVAVMGGIKERQLQGGYLTFKQALKTVFTIFIIFIILDTLFSQLLLNVIDVPFREALMQNAGVKMEKFLAKMGADQDTIDKALADMQDPSNFGFKKVLLGVLFRCIIWFIVSLIIAAIIKKKRPEFENQI